MRHLLETLAEVVEFIELQLRNGVSKDDILSRLTDPHGLGQRLVDAVAQRRDKIADFVENG